MEGLSVSDFSVGTKLVYMLFDRRAELKPNVTRINVFFKYAEIRALDKSTSSVEHILSSQDNNSSDSEEIPRLS